MSTMGIVAVGTITEWRGVFNSSSSSPTFLGKTLREDILEKIHAGKSLQSVCREILAYDSWESYQNGGLCPYCGNLTTQPHSMSADLVIGFDSSDEFPDPDCLRHEHEPMDALEVAQFTSDTLEDDSSVEWIYVINPKLRIIHVIDNRAKYGRHLHVGSIALHGPEPNYEHLQCGEDYGRCSCLARVHFPVEGSPQERLTAKEYMGNEPIGAMSDACAVIINGKRHAWNGIASPADALKADSQIENALLAELNMNGEKQFVTVGVSDQGASVPAPGVAWVFPATAVMPEFAVIGK
jgi:hypothetical protein